MELRTINWYAAVAKGEVPGHSIVTKHGRNPSVGTSNEDIWNGGDIYTGFNATAADILEVSAGINDTGSLLSSGNVSVTSDASARNVIVDLGATFVTDGVAIGDIFINDTIAAHGIITAVAETEITVWLMVKGDEQLVSNALGDAYRIATATGTGAAVVHLDFGLDANYLPIEEHVILNGGNVVETTKEYIRMSRSSVDLPGSSGSNLAAITVKAKATPLNIFSVLPIGYNQTKIAAYTVNAGERGYLVDSFLGMGGTGNATVSGRLRARDFGGAFQVQDDLVCSANGNNMTNIPHDLPKGPYLPGTDVKMEALATTSQAVVAGFDLLIVQDGF